MKPYVAIDVDGVFADFHAGVLEHTGRDIYHFRGEDEKLWDELGKVDNLFYTLPVIPGSLDLIRYLEKKYIEGKIDAEFLTAIPRPTGKLATADHDKRKWLYEKVSKIVPVSTVVGGKNKGKFVKKNQVSILIDDYDRNINVWRETGGIGILHVGVGDTMVQLAKVGI